ncbi:MAG: hypothetical protein V1740_06005 [Candidatus Woesearchaeota archaeon]
MEESEEESMVKEDVIDIMTDLDNQPERHEIEKERVEDGKGDSGKLILLIAVVIMAFIIFIGGSYFYNKYYTVPEPIVETITYNGFEFVYYEDLWHFQWQRENDLFNVHLRFNPKEVEDVPVEIKNPFNNLSTETVYLAFDPLGNNTEYMVLATGELGLSLKKVFGKNPNGTCTRNETEACNDRPAINCDNTNQSVIILEEKGDSKVTVDDNCLIISGERIELLRAVDRVLYEWYGILELE